MQLSQQAIQFIIYPLIVLAISGIVTLVVRSIIKYFNKLNTTLTKLNETIQLIILDQTKVHAEQDKNMSILQEEVDTEKVIRAKHRKDIDELFDITSKHTVEIEVLKKVTEGK
jgi:predicted PurR-regulated permease PerM